MGQPWQLAHPTTPTTMHTPAQPHTAHKTHLPVEHQPFFALQPTAPSALPNTHREEEPPTPTQEQTTPTTAHNHVHHAWERGRNTRNKATDNHPGPRGHWLDIEQP